MKKGTILKMMFVLAILIGTASCSKNQRSVNKLEGNWKSSIATINGVNISGVEITLDFNKCKLKKDDYCSGTWEEAYPNLQGSQSSIFSFEYKVESDGDELIIKDGTSQITYNMQLDKDELDLNWVDNGVPHYVKLQRQD